MLCCTEHCCSCNTRLGEQHKHFAELRWIHRFEDFHELGSKLKCLVLPLSSRDLHSTSETSVITFAIFVLKELMLKRAEGNQIWLSGGLTFFLKSQIQCSDQRALRSACLTETRYFSVLELHIPFITKPSIFDTVFWHKLSVHVCELALNHKLVAYKNKKREVNLIVVFPLLFYAKA